MPIVRKNTDYAKVFLIPATPMNILGLYYHGNYKTILKFINEFLFCVERCSGKRDQCEMDTTSRKQSFRVCDGESNCTNMLVENYWNI